ncbi:MAG: type IV toxin-antitoxin system AbiEi family antitoxin [Rhodococcus sp. (in: high G+C Gram-positive bacteria)]|uniref:type IV toxin-antitoxin system AbiEi family antitoxin n=1 Tax=Rhodococcus sp. EPR-157 TaxID=1813677 RepID=UPI000AE96058|nr:type IV toxin-antitoxin system AbiEi family antitoxin [Rhodococcus sp. EPR-157]
MPGLEAAAAGIAVAAYGLDDAVVMGVSSARLHGVIPRALATAVIAVPTRHDPIRSADRQAADRQAVVRFVVRDTTRLDAERIRTELGPVLVTTPEQTVLDLMKRPVIHSHGRLVWDSAISEVPEHRGAVLRLQFGLAVKVQLLSASVEIERCDRRRALPQAIAHRDFADTYVALDQG